MTDLKPCHVCKRKPRISGCRTLCGYWCMVTHAEADHSVWISAEAETKEKSKALAIEKWNRRHYPAEVQKAMERMTPKKVIRRKTYGKKGTDEEYILFTEYSCPTCGIEIPIMDMDTKFCADGCGQALDWSNDE